MANNTDVSNWTYQDVYDWALEAGGEKCALLLRKEEVDGSALLAQTEASLRAFGILGGPATKLCLALKSLRSSRQSAVDMALDADYRCKVDTHSLLAEVWDSIGTSPQDRQAFLHHLSEEVQALYHNRLQEQRDVKASSEEKVRGLQSHISSLSDQLQVGHPDPVSVTVPLLQQIAVLTSQLDNLKQEKEVQQVRNGKGLAELAQLYTVLGEPLPDIQRLYVGAHRLVEIQSLISQGHQKIIDKRNLLANAKARVHAELQDLVLADDEYTELDRLVLVESADIPLSALDQLERRGEELEEMKITRKENLKVLARKIAAIWNILGVPLAHRTEFMGVGNAGLGRTTFEKCEKELADLEAQKRIELPRLLKEYEIRLSELWTETSTSAREQVNFRESYAVMSNEVKFTAIKQQIENAEAKLIEMKDILDFVKHREKILTEASAYTELQSDPNRFKIAGLPLKLEQMRKNFQSFPKLAAKMKLIIEEWEEQNGPFLRAGDRLLATMEASGEFAEGYVPGGEPRRALKAEPVVTPRKPLQSTMPRSGRKTPLREAKYASQSLPSALTPAKKEPSCLVNARARAPLPSARKRSENIENHAKFELPTKNREKPTPESTAASKRVRTPFKESNY